MNNVPQNNGEKKMNWRKINAILWTCIIVLIVLVLLTATVLVITIGNFLPNEVNVFFLVPKEPSFEAGGENGSWSADNSLEIFKSEYRNGKGEIIIQSSNGDDVIAPGAEVDYSFDLNNNGNIALDYEMDMNFKFTIDGEETSLEEIPVEVRLRRNDGTYLAGDEENFIPVHAVSTVSDDGTLGVKSYVGYTLDLKWSVDAGDDLQDTYLGNLSCEKDVVFSLEISTYATENSDPYAQGGTVDEDADDEAVGGSIRWWPFAILLWIILLLIAASIWLFILKRRRKKEEESEQY